MSIKITMRECIQIGRGDVKDESVSYGSKRSAWI